MQHVSEKDVKGSAKVRKHPHINASHPIHHLAAKLHAKVKAAHPDTSLDIDDFFDTLCNDDNDDLDLPS